LLGGVRPRQEDRQGKAAARVDARSGHFDGKKKPEMKSSHAVELALSMGPCQRPGCLNLGRRRLQQRWHTTWSLYLCNWCLESLLPIDLNDLFVKFGTILKINVYGIDARRARAKNKTPLNRRD
jgi:hypothetical protein